MPQLTYLDLLHRASEKAKEARAIIDKALNENRELTPQELAKVDALGKQSDNLREQGEAMEAAERRTLYFQQPAGPGPVELPGMTYTTEGYDPRECRSFRHGEPLTGKAKNGLSIGKLIRGLAVGKWDNAQAEQRVMSSLTGSAGGILVPETLALEVIDLFRAESVLSAAGMQTYPMSTADVTHPVIASDPEASWIGEHGDFPDSEPTLDFSKLSAKKLGVITKASTEFFEDSPQAAAVIENLLGVAIAQEVDSSAMFGDGVGKPQGICNDTRIQKIDMGINGGTLTSYNKILEAVQILMQNNVPTGPEEISVILSPREWAVLAELRETAGPYIAAPPWLTERVTFRVASKMPINLTKGTSSDASQILVGRFSELTLGVRTDVVLEVSRSAGDSSGSAFRKGQVWVRAYMRCDTAIRRPTAFVIIDGIVPA